MNEADNIHEWKQAQSPVKAILRKNYRKWSFHRNPISLLHDQLFLVYIAMIANKRFIKSIQSSQKMCWMVKRSW